MAIQACKECGNPISTKAKACPHCGARKASSWSDSCFGLCLIAIALAVVVLMKSCDFGSDPWSDPNRGSREKSARPVKVELTKSASLLMVKNTDNSTWPSFKIYLNGLISAYEFEYSKSFEPGEEIVIDLTDFAKRSGLRFQPSKYEVKEITFSVPGYDAPIFKF